MPELNRVDSGRFARSSMKVSMANGAQEPGATDAKRRRDRRHGILAPPDHGSSPGGLLRVHPWVSLGFSRGLREERAHEWTKGLATARRACKLALLVLPNRQGESHRTLAFVAVVFVHGHRGPSDWPAPRSVTRTKRSDNIAFRSPGKRQCGECLLLDYLIRQGYRPRRLPCTAQ